MENRPLIFLDSASSHPDRSLITPPLCPPAAIQQGSIRRPGVPAFLLLFLLFTAPFPVKGANVVVPIELDYQLMRLLLISQLFNTPEQSAEILNDPTGCSRILLTNPRVGPRQAELEIITDVRATLGVGSGGRCAELLQWRGSAGFLGRPIVQPGATAVRIEPTDTWLAAADGSKITSGKLWDLARPRLQPLLNRFTFDLAPSIQALGTMLPEVLPHRSAQQVQTIVDSLTVSDIQVSASSLDISLQFQVEELAEQPRPEAALTDQELQQWESRWQMMDALFTFAVKHYASATGLQELRGTLLDVLIDSRYRLRDALTAPASRSDDPVRHWFVDSWKQLSPVIRQIGLEQTGQEPLVWISLLTATDALYALDRLGPSIGLEISADGLRRLARLINAKTTADPLRYDEAVDPDLQRLFLDPAPLAPEQPSGFRFDLWPVSSAWAATSTERLDLWAPRKDQLGEYLPLVARLLNTTVDEALKKSGLEPQVSKLFRQLVLATAWQESCWRQFVVVKGKVEPLRSGSGDVGLMQINEKVWRGFYDIQKLRWDVSYNSQAGAGVLLNYLVKYALKRAENKRPGGLDNLARASYSAYNGGPGQVSRYRNSRAASTHKKVDAAFWKKYQQVKAGNELNVIQCLDGGAKIPAKGQPAPTRAKNDASNNKKRPAAAPGAASRDDGERWASTQDNKHFTLQLAVFSKRESARKFIAQHKLTGQAGIFPNRKGKTTQFTVLYGSYAKRADADRAKSRLKHLKPWVRQFGEVRKTGR